MEPFFKDNEIELQQEFLRNIKIRAIEQKFLYFGEGMKRYYGLYKDRDMYRWNPTEKNAMRWVVGSFEPFLEKHISRDKKIGFISLGCGIAADDKDIMTILHKSGYNFTWVGFDSSTAMVSKAEESFQDVEFDYQLHVADITTYEFYKKTEKIIETFDMIVFMFIGGTIGNMVQTEIVDTLYNLMKPNHLLWFDCVIRHSNHKTENLEIFNKYAQRLHNKSWTDFIAHPLDYLGIPREAGTLALENTVEESIGVLNFRYSFRFKELCTTRFLDEYIHFVPPESLKLLDVRTYHVDTMVKYFEQHHFKHLDSMTIPLDGQFLFTKMEN